MGPTIEEICGLMSYAERKQMSSNKTAGLIAVAVIHLALGYALVTGLAYNVMKQAAEDYLGQSVTKAVMSRSARVLMEGAVRVPADPAYA